MDVSVKEDAVPIACRYGLCRLSRGLHIPLSTKLPKTDRTTVPYDQWLVTHALPSCKIAQLKLFVLSRCFGISYPDTNHPPHHRPPSPLTFASPPRQASPPITFASPDRDSGDNNNNNNNHHHRSKVIVDNDDHGDLEEETNRGYEEDDEHSDDDSSSVPRASYHPPRTYRPSRPHSRSSAIPFSRRTPPPAASVSVSPSAAATPSPHVSPPSIEHSFSAPPPKETPSVPSPCPAAFTLVRFSTGQILEDAFPLSNYDLAPYELLELHGEHSMSMTKPVFPPHHQYKRTAVQTPKPSKLIRHIVSFDRSDVQAYVAPYWEGWVKALRVVRRDEGDTSIRSEAQRKALNHHPGDGGLGDSMNIFGPLGIAGYAYAVGGGGGSAFGIFSYDEHLKLRDEDVAGFFPDTGRDGKSKRGLPKKKSGRGSKVKLEWKERWVTVQGDTLYICKDREDVDPTQCLSLSSVVTILDKDFLLNYPSASTSPFVPSNAHADSILGFEQDPTLDSFPTGDHGKDRTKNHSKYVICARFRTKTGHDGRASSVKTPVRSSSLAISHSKSSSRHTIGEAYLHSSRSQPKKDVGKGDSFPEAYYHQMSPPAANTHVPTPSGHSESNAGTGDDVRSASRGFSFVSMSATMSNRGPKARTIVDDASKQAAPPPVASGGGDSTGVVMRPGSAYKSTDEGQTEVEGVNAEDRSLPGLLRVLSPSSPTMAVPTVSLHDSKVAVTSARPDLPPASPSASLSHSDVSSPIFAHSSESEWEKSIFGPRDRSKQPYQYGYRPANRWKDTREYAHARDVWQEELEREKRRSIDDSGETMEKNKGKPRDKGKGKEKDSKRREKHPTEGSDQHEWIILDMGAGPAFNSMLRILHRGSPFAGSSFKTNYFHKISPEAGYTPGPSSQRGHDSSSPMRKRGRRQRSHGTSSDTDVTYSDRLLSTSFPPDVLSWNEKLGVMPYPEWRMMIARRAQKAALGNIGNGMAYQIFGSLEFGKQVNTPLGVEPPSGGPLESPKEKPKRMRNRARSHASAATATLGSGSEDAGRPLLDFESSDERSSELEWHCWILDITRQAQGQGRREMKSLTPDLDLYGSEAIRRAVLEPRATVVSTPSPPDVPTPAPSSTPTRPDPLSPIGPLPSSSHASSSDAHAQNSSRMTPFYVPFVDRSIRFPSLSSRSSFETLSTSHQSLKSQTHLLRVPGALHHSNSMYSSLLRSEVPAHLPSRRPSMPLLALEQHLGYAKSDFSSNHADARQLSAASSQRSQRRDMLRESPGSALEVSSTVEAGSARMQRQASTMNPASGIAGTLGRSASLFIGGLWRKEPKDSSRDANSDDREKKGKGKGKMKAENAAQQRPESSHEASLRLPKNQLAESSHQRTPSPLRSPTSASRLRRATSGSSLASLEYEPPTPSTGSKTERRKLRKKGGLVYEVEKVA